MRLRNEINRIFKRHPDHPFAALWRWGTRHAQAKRFAALERWAHRRAVWAANHHTGKWDYWHAKEVAYRKKKERWIKHHQQQHDGWPDSMLIVELYNNDNGYHNHVHVASPERDKLIQIARIAQDQYAPGPGYVREFPPFDPVDCVHVSSSWHYRDSSNPYVIRSCSNRGDGCAFDFGAPNRDAFGLEVKRRYGAQSCDF